MMNPTTQHEQRPGDPRVERTRALVIAAAAELLMDDGPGAITHANVASAANVSRTTVYNHWPTREDLLRATIDSIGKATPDVDDLTGSLRVDLEILCQQLVSDLIDEQRAPMIANMMETGASRPRSRRGPQRVSRAVRGCVRRRHLHSDRRGRAAP